MNILTYSGTTPIPDTTGDLSHAEGLTIQRGYPGGRDLAARMFVPRNPARPWLVRQGQRMVIKSGVRTVFDGSIVNIGTRLGERPGNTIDVLGPWGEILMRQRLQKYWADSRITDQAWREWEGPYPKCGLSRSNGALRLTPKGDFAVDEVAFRARYTMPTDETIKRAVMDYDLNEYAEWKPAGVMFYDSSALSYVDVADGDSVTLDTGDWLYIFGKEELLNASGIRIGLSVVNNNAATLDVEVYSSAWANVAALADGTASGGAPLAVSGDIVFTEIEDCKETTVNSKSGRFMRIGSSALLDAVTITSVAFLMLQAWELRLRDRDGVTDIWSVTANGAGTRDDTLGTARQHLEIQLVSRAAQSAPSNGSIFGEISNIMMLSETGDISVYNIFDDIRAAVSRLSSYTGKLSANGYQITPFISDWITAADILTEAAKKGDGSSDSWGYGLLPSDEAAAPDGKPVLFLEQFRALTATDYVISASSPNLVGGLDLEDTTLETENNEITEWRGEDGLTYWISPLDDATLRDAESDTAYGRKDGYMQSENTDLAAVLAEARRRLQARKGRAGYVASPIRVMGWIYSANGARVPAAQIEPGRRIQIIDHPGRPILLIVGVDYDHDSRTASITVDKGGASYGI